MPEHVTPQINLSITAKQRKVILDYALDNGITTQKGKPILSRAIHKLIAEALAAEGTDYPDLPQHGGRRD